MLSKIYFLNKKSYKTSDYNKKKLLILLCLIRSPENRFNYTQHETRNTEHGTRNALYTHSVNIWIPIGRIKKTLPLSCGGNADVLRSNITPYHHPNITVISP